MIVYTGPFILSAAASAYPLTLPRICYQTWTQQAVPADVTVSDEDVGFPGDAPLRADTYERWKPLTLPATWQLEFNATRNIDYVGLAGHNFGSAAISILVEYQLGAGSWTTFASGAAPADDSPLLYLDTAVDCNRIRITLSSTGTMMPQLGVVYVGTSMPMPQPVNGKYRPINMSRDTLLKAALSRGGQFLGQDYRRNGVSGEIGFQLLTASWVRSNFDAFSKAARKYPYFLAWDPLDFPNEVGYVWSEKDIVPAYMQMGSFMEVAWSMKGVGAA